MLGVVVLVGENRALILRVCIQAEVVVVVGKGSWEALELIAIHMLTCQLMVMHNCNSSCVPGQTAVVYRVQTALPVGTCHGNI
jgi:hypothetical protein